MNIKLIFVITALVTAGYSCVNQIAAIKGDFKPSSVNQPYGN